MIINRANLTGLNTAFNTLFQGAFAGVKPTYGQIATEVPSSTAEEEYGWLGDIPGMREWIGPRVVNNIADHKYTVRNKTWEDTISVPREKIEDDRYGIYNPLFTELGRAAGAHPDELVWAALAAGFTAECYDGQAFFDTDHPVGDATAGGVQSVSNMQAGASPAWFLLDATRALKPLIFQKRQPVAFVAKTNLSDDNVFYNREFVWGADARYNTGYGFWQMAFGSTAALDSANFNAARVAMMNYKNDAGRKLGIKPNLLVIGASNSKKARDLLIAETGANGASNTDKGLVQILESPLLD